MSSLFFATINVSYKGPTIYIHQTKLWIVKFKFNNNECIRAQWILEKIKCPPWNFASDVIGSKIEF